MTPFQKAVELYHLEPCARTFPEDLKLHLHHGFVFSTPDYFIMGRPVDSSAPTAEIVNPAVNWPREQCDAWEVYLMAGNVAKVWDILPWPLPKVCFERKNELRCYSLDTMRRMCIPE